MSSLISGERSQCVLLDGGPLKEVDKLQHPDSTRFTYIGFANLIEKMRLDPPEEDFPSSLVCGLFGEGFTE